MRTDLCGATLRGADLRYADASRARFLEVDLSGARLDGCRLIDAEMEA